jgi:transposase
MDTPKTIPKRFIGLDVHKHYLIAIGVDADLGQVYGPKRVQLSHIETWIQKTLQPDDALVLEMTTNTWQLYDELCPHVHSVTVVHPPHVVLITRAQVMTDKIAASTLARLLAKGLLFSVWVPPIEVREQRALIAQRSKMTRLATQAKNRLHALLHRHHITLPPGDPFLAERYDWWLNLPVSTLEKVNLQSDLDTLAFARNQVNRFTAALKTLAANDPRVFRLVHLPGISIVTAQTILAAIGDIQRFPNAKKLVGYAGLGARVHDSGQTTRTGRITKAGRKDLRSAMVETAHVAANFHPFWQQELNRLEPRLGRNKAIIAIARKLLVTVWFVLAEECVDRHAQPEIVARKYLQFIYDLSKEHRPAQPSAAAFVRSQLDQLGLGADLDSIPWGTKKKPLPLPPSSLKTA